MAKHPQELAQDALCQSHTGHMTGLWFLPNQRLNTNEWMRQIYSSLINVFVKDNAIFCVSSQQNNIFYFYLDNMFRTINQHQTFVTNLTIRST